DVCSSDLGAAEGAAAAAVGGGESGGVNGSTKLVGACVQATRGYSQRRARSYKASANPSVARISASTLPGSNAECPASGVISSFASGQARWISHALRNGQTTS